MEQSACGKIIYSEIRGKKGTVELGVEGNARLGSEHLHTFSHLNPHNSPAK